MKTWHKGGTLATEVERAEFAHDRAILEATYANYDAKRHDAFAMIYNEDLERQARCAYELARGIRTVTTADFD